jgi:hypothetical protein
MYKNSIIGQYVNYETNKTKWKKDKISGKLSEISLQTSTYNKIIPLMYGTNKLAGNIIWLGEVKEVVNNNTTTLKIGKGQKINQTSINYLYYLSFAVAICRGEVKELKNVWADTKLLDLTTYSHRFYSGTDTQQPDSLIEVIEGAGRVSAYRDICYVVFENFPLSEFNNRLPNFLFEIVKQNEIELNSDGENSLENCIKGINIIPSCGEFSLNTTTQYKAGEQFIESIVEWVSGIWYPLNENNNSKISDALLSLNNLLTELPNCEWFSPHIAFFGDSLNILDCTLKPRVSFNFFYTNYPIYTRPDKYNIGTKWDRYNTPLLSKDSTGKFRFQGGTSSDNSVLSFYGELKNRGKKTVFRPEILIDIENTPSKKLLSGNIGNVHDFFIKNNGYNEFILHYASLLKDYVDVFLIGSEMIGLTSLQNTDDYSFPAVDELINLAEQVRNIVGNSVKISYAAGYREYHNFNGWYNLDKLWMSEYIDFIGINAYFPLTNLPQNDITKEIIKSGWFSGEGFDYSTINGNRVEIDDKYAYKNMEYWWKNVHINPDGVQTLWIPESKKMWFTEYGFCSVDGTTNEPYRNAGDFPVYSNGNVDFFAQRMAIEATEEAFVDSDFIENKLLYCWDARPYPFFPNKIDLWNDCEIWKYGHWLNGKTRISNANVLIYQLFRDAGLDTNIIDKIEIDEFVDGFVINNSLSVRDALYILQKVYYFDCVEENSKISFISNKSSIRDGKNIVNIYEEDLVATKRDGKNAYIDVSVTSGNNLPKRLDLIFIDKNNDYDTTSVYAERSGVESDKNEVETLPVVLDEEKARNIAEISLYLSWLEKTVFNFILPLKYLYLTVSDLIRLHLDDKSYVLKIGTITLENNTLRVRATQFDNTIYNYVKDISLNPNIEILLNAGMTNLKIIELPAMNQNMLDKIHLFFIITNELPGWKGANIYFSGNNGRTYEILSGVREISMVGSVSNVPKPAKPYYFDNQNKLKVFFYGKIDTDLLENIGDLELLNGANTALYGNEIIQFSSIVLNDDGSYTVGRLLRGLYDTEDEINNHSSDDIFVFLNKNIFTWEFDHDKINFCYNYKAVSFDKDMADAQNIKYTINGRNLKPFAPCHLTYKIIDDGNLLLTWEEKGRGYSNWLSNVDYVSGEKYTKYCLEIETNGIIKTIYTEERNYILEVENGELPNKIRMCMVNELYGRGKWRKFW